MKFLKYRYKFAYGYDKFQYMVVADDITIDSDYLKEIISELHGEYDYSDRYRGIDYDIIDNPPIEWLEREIETYSKKIIHYNNLITIYKKLIQEQ